MGIFSRGPKGIWTPALVVNSYALLPDWAIGPHFANKIGEKWDLNPCD